MFIRKLGLYVGPLASLDESDHKEQQAFGEKGCTFTTALPQLSSPQKAAKLKTKFTKFPMGSCSVDVFPVSGRNL